MNKNPFYSPNDTNKAISIMGSYFEAVQWTEELESEKVDVSSWRSTYNDCYSFIEKIMTNEKYKESNFIIDWNNQEMMNQMGHDLWLTRNGHGAGFWDRPEIWGDCADVFSDIARSMGEKSAWVENKILFIE